MFYSFKNAPIKLNGNDIFCKAADVSTKTDLQPNYINNNRNSFEYVPNGAVGGNLSINYYLTGQDYLKTFINLETGTLSGNFGGLYFETGYLQSYSFTAAPNLTVVINSNIVFFDELKGNFNGVVPNNYNNLNILNFSDITLDNLNGYSTETISSINSIQFNYSNQINPVYVIESGGREQKNVLPDSVNFGQKEISTVINCDNLNPDLPITGKNLGIKINFNHPSISSLSENFTCSGVLMSKTVNAQINQVLNTTFTIKQNNTQDNPTISGITMLSAPGDFILISGKNLTNTYELWYGDREANRFSVINDILVSGIVPQDALTGKVYLKSYGGETFSTNNYSLTYPSMTIQGVTNYTGFSGQTIGISGNNLYRISDVFFNNSPANFYSVNSGLIYAEVPNCSSGYIRVVSTGRLISANSSDHFVPYPIISGFTPATGMSGLLISISGNNFGGINSVKFNNITASFSITNNNLITATIPTGNVYGNIFMQGASGVYTYSPAKFFPSTPITGLFPSTAKSNEKLIISGFNFQSGLMYPIGDNYFRVGFNGGVLGAFRWNSNESLSGLVPSGSISGPISIYMADGASVYSETGNLTKKNDPPVLYRIAPINAYSGYLYNGFIEGANLFNINKILFSGGRNTNSGRLFEIPNSFISTDLMGNRLNIINYTGFTGIPPLANLFGKYFTGLFQVQVHAQEGTGFLPIFTRTGLNVLIA